MTKTPALLTLPQCKNRVPCKWLGLERCEEEGDARCKGSSVQAGASFFKTTVLIIIFEVDLSGPQYCPASLGIILVLGVWGYSQAFPGPRGGRAIREVASDFVPK